MLAKCAQMNHSYSRFKFLGVFGLYVPLQNERFLLPNIAQAIATVLLILSICRRSDKLCVVCVSGT